MEEKTQKELIISLVKMQQKHGNDLVEIKTCLLGDQYHPKGLIHQVVDHSNCIDDIKKKRLPDIEQSIEKRSGIIGGIVAFIVVVATSAVNYLIFKK